MTATKKRPAVGDERWEVQWCIDVPKDENGDCVLDQADDRFAMFQTKAAAMRHAKKVYTKDFFGSVRITPMRFVPFDEDDALRFPHAGYWDAIGDSEFYEGGAS